MRVLDTCASPGGKTTAMAAMAGDRADIVAADVRGARVQLLRETVSASGAQHVRVVQADLEAGLPFGPAFDVVFVDAPCSGLGTVRRDPDIRWRRAEGDLAPLASAQLTMLRHAAEAVRSGGRLVYATCSSEPEENDRVVASFLAGNSDFTKVDLRADKPAHFDALAPVLDEARCPAHVPSRTWPRGLLRRRPAPCKIGLFEMQFRNRMWSAGRLFAIAACLVATYLLFAVTAMRVALRVREVPVPDLRNHTVAEATAQLQDAGLALTVDQSGRLDPKVPAGRIALQDPAAGAVTRRQRSVRVWMSQGPRITTIPTLTGESERAAQLRLQQDGLAVTSLAEVRSSDFPSGTVIAQEPPGSARGTEVALLVNRGERSHNYVMPDLIGVAGSRAVDLLRARGFRVTIVGELPYPGVPAGIVLRQFPAAGFQIAAGDPISLEVSR